jgi:hypothetical protein
VIPAPTLLEVWLNLLPNFQNKVSQYLHACVISVCTSPQRQTSCCCPTVQPASAHVKVACYGWALIPGTPPTHVLEMAILKLGSAIRAVRNEVNWARLGIRIDLSGTARRDRDRVSMAVARDCKARHRSAVGSSWQKLLQTPRHVKEPAHTGSVSTDAGKSQRINLVRGLASPASCQCLPSCRPHLVARTQTPCCFSQVSRVHPECWRTMTGRASTA